MDLNTILNNPFNQTVFILVIIWSLIWKGFSLWRAARNTQRNWFIAMLIINTFGILEIIYLFYFSKSPSQKEPQNP